MKQLFKIVTILIIHASFFIFHCFSQDIATDTTRANEYWDLAVNYYKKKQNFDSVLHYLNKAQPLFIKYFGEKSLKNSDIFLLKGIVARNQSKYDSALVYYSEVLQLYKVISGENSSNVAKAYNNIGNVYKDKNLYDKALEYYLKSLNIRKKVYGEKHNEVAMSYNNIAMVYINKSEYDKALEYLLDCIKIRTELFGENYIDLTPAYENIGNVYIEKSEYDKAMEYFLKSLKIKKEMSGEKNTTVALSYYNIGTVYYNRSEFNSALEYYFKSIKILQELVGEKNFEMARTYNAIGLTYDNKSEYDKALEYCLKSLKINIELVGENHTEVATSYNTIGLIFQEKGEYDKALEYFFKCLKIRTELLGENQMDIAATYDNIGIIYTLKLDYAKALEYYFKSLEIRKGLVNKKNTGLAASFDNIGTDYYKTLEYEKALEYYFESLKILKEIFGQKHSSIANSYYNIGNVYSALKQYDKALKYYHCGMAANLHNFNDTTNLYAIPEMNNYFDYKYLLQSLQAKARLLADTTITLSKLKTLSKFERLKLTICNYQAADKLIDKSRIEISKQSDKISLGEKANQIYSEAIDVCLKLANSVETRHALFLQNYYRELAFYFSEKNKSSVLLEALAGQEAQKFAEIPDSLLKIEKKLKSYITSFTNKLSDANKTDSLLINKYNDNLFSCNRSYDSLMVVFETQFPKYYDLKYNTKPVQVNELRSNVENNKKTALISYHVSDSSITIFTVTKNNLDIQQIAKPRNFNETLHLFRTSLRNVNNTAFYKVYKRLGYNLYNLLFPKVLLKKEFKKIDNLIIIPDATIGTIPFETLLTDSIFYQQDFQNLANFKNMPYLIKTYNISYSYSANLFYRTFRREAPHGASLPKPEFTDLQDWLALAPVFSDNQTADLCLRTREMLQTITASNDSLTRDYFKGNKITSLPGTETEVKSIYNLFENKNKKAMVLLNHKANKSFILSDSISYFNIIHFATHGFVNSEKPELSGLLLAQDSLHEENGILTTGEIYNIKLNADLVVLSACETALGKIVKGEGVIGLTRALLYAGTKNIIVSLWKVSDASTSVLMNDFYENLLNQKSAGFSKSGRFGASLRKAKLKMISEGKYAHPFYWSPFILIGK